jgi:hypothetical protein
MRLFREGQPDPDGSPGGAVVKSVVDELSDLSVHAWDLLQPGSDGLELFEAYNLRIFQRFPSADGQEQTTEGIIRVLRRGAGHPTHILACESGAAARGHQSTTAQGIFSFPLSHQGLSLMTVQIPISLRRIACATTPTPAPWCRSGRFPGTRL